jgi:molybdopterin-guanine dinucleotide biosynthesis protein A
VDDPQIAAAILAGGQARRFGGRDKSRLVIDGRTIIVRQLDVLQRVASELFIVAPDGGRYRDLGVPVYADVIPASGPMGGLATALERARAPRVLVVACDLPFLDVALLTALVDAARDGDGAWARSPRGVEPLVACYRRSARGAVRGAILAGRLALAGLDGVLRMHAIDVGTGAGAWSDRALENVNTPADYDRLQ